MKTQISRDSFQPQQHFSGVYLQQGRMILDADWNELTDIQKARLVDALRDAIAGGAPRAGGLRIFADPSDSTNIRIQPGALYVEGTPARLDAGAPLEVDKQPDYPIVADYTGQNLKLYADVWERSVTALERSDLLDAALHGADTATRSQTLLQVKWCANTLDPLDPAVNPPIGNAPLSLKLRLIASSGDPCNPCADQVKVDERLGNYLFRVEVHDYDAASKMLTLKWSRDNGAEASATASLPPGFSQGDWVFEYFDADTERLLGNHFAPNPKKLRGLIKETAETPTGNDEPKTYVRQWDGYIKINLTNGALSGRDRGVPLATGLAANQSHGRVNLTGGVLKVNLELMELELATDGKSLVPGDYWQAVVREAVNNSGDAVLANALPRGVRHHYLYLGELGVNKKLVDQDNAFRRRMNFPPLTDITAADVGFSDHCVGLFADAKNVQQALDNLCAISAEDIAYLLPNCGANEGKSIKDNLKTQLDPNSDNKLTVKDALDTLLCLLNAAALPYTVPACASSPNVSGGLGLAAGNNNVAAVLDKLLCEFKANDLPLDKTDATLCTDLQPPTVATVQDALKVLCVKSGGCSVVASSPQHLELLLKEFAANGTATDLWICLKAGTYPMGDIPAITGKRSLRISGEGPESVSIPFSGGTLSLGAKEVILENLSVTFGKGDGQILITADTSKAHGCHFSRIANQSGGPSMITVSGTGGGISKLSWRDNELYAQVAQIIGTGDQWAGPSVVGDALASQALLDLGKPEILNDKTAYDAALNKAVSAVLAMAPATRLQWKTNLDKIVATKDASPMMLMARAPVAGKQNISDILASQVMSRQETAMAIEDLVAQWIFYFPDYALRLNNQKVGGVIENNRVEGWLLLGNGVNGFTNPDNLFGVDFDGPVVNTGGEDLKLIGNSLAALKANLPAQALTPNKTLAARINGYARLTLSGNRFVDDGNIFTAINLAAQGNHWYGNDSDLGYAVVDRAVFTGNLVEDTVEFSRIRATVNQEQLVAVGNLLLNVFTMR